MPLKILLTESQGYPLPLAIPAVSIVWPHRVKRSITPGHLIPDMRIVSQITLTNPCCAVGHQVVVLRFLLKESVLASCTSYT